MKRYKEIQPFEVRSVEAQRMLEKYPDRIPVIIEKSASSRIENIDKRKFLVPTDLTFGQLIGVVRKRINISKEKAIFLFCQNTIPASTTVVGTIYESFKDEDGFLYLEYSGENTFGNKI
jgi:GABA(A) receptor-associated protein